MSRSRWQYVGIWGGQNVNRWILEGQNSNLYHSTMLPLVYKLSYAAWISLAVSLTLALKYHLNVIQIREGGVKTEVISSWSPFQLWNQQATLFPSRDGKYKIDMSTPMREETRPRVPSESKYSRARLKASSKSNSLCLDPIPVRPDWGDKLTEAGTHLHHPLKMSCVLVAFLDWYSVCHTHLGGSIIPTAQWMSSLCQGLAAFPG